MIPVLQFFLTFAFSVANDGPTEHLARTSQRSPWHGEVMRPDAMGLA